MIPDPISKNFDWSEFECHCECEMPSDVRKNIRFLVRSLLQPMRTLLGTPITVVSGYRCRSHNRAVGGATNSRHMEGKAADIKLKGMKPFSTYQMLNLVLRNNAWGPGGLGVYSTWVHVDLRETTRAIRWNKQ